MTHYFGALAIVCEIPIVWRGTCTQSIHGPGVNVFSPKFTQRAQSVSRLVQQRIYGVLRDAIFKSLRNQFIT